MSLRNIFDYFKKNKDSHDNKNKNSTPNQKRVFISLSSEKHIEYIKSRLIIYDIKLIHDLSPLVPDLSIEGSRINIQKLIKENEAIITWHGDVQRIN